jgi:hypothetical protein
MLPGQRVSGKPGPLLSDASVHHYRVYLIDDDGHIKKAVDLECENDDQAKKQAQQFVDSCSVELWQGGRQIAVLDKPS